MMLGVKSLMLYAAIYWLYGLLNGALQNVLVALLTRKYTTTGNNFLMGFWAATMNMGGILISLLFTVMIYYLKVDWKWCLVVIPIMASVTAGLLKLFE